MKTLLCIIHSPSNNTSLIEQKVSEKLKSETSNLNIIIKNPFFSNTEDILKADGLLIGTTENLASMAGATKDFFDRNYYNVIEKKEGMPVVVWIRAGHDGTGTTIQMKSIIKGLKWRLVQEILICKGPWQKKFIDQCINLSLGFAIGLESNIY